MNKFNSKPIYWVDSNVDTTRWRGNNIRKHPDGRVERLPSFAYDGPHDNRTVNEATRRRYRTMLDHVGNVKSVVHSHGGADVAIIQDGRFSTHEYARHIIAKAFHFGWIDVNAGCLLLQLDRGLVDEAKLLVSIDAARPCLPNSAACSHIEAEQAERRRRHEERMKQWERDVVGESAEVKMAAAIADVLEARDTKKKRERSAKEGKPTKGK